ncbi:MAG: hypothetical protein V2I43_25515 [Parvularcula sp.]|nr:hypothetical protein [Parvularcula sp.]
METYEPGSEDVREVVYSYFVDSVQGLARGHNSSTFDESTNDLALLPASVEPVQKIIRLERIDRLLEPQGGLDFGSLVDALRTGDQHRLSALADQFQSYPGERPSFAAFKSEVSDDLKEADWLQRIIDRLGLYHHYPFVPGKPYRFALMEYTADEVIKQAHAKGADRCFSLATVLECQDNPAFFPVPRSTSHGFTVDLRERNPKKPSVREILHIRFDYSWRHVKRLAEWSGADVPDIEVARGRHLDTLRTETGRTDFGEVGI